MKKLLLLFVCSFFLQATAQSTLTAEQWQEDLKFLQNTVHSDYSFLFKKTTAADFDKAVDKLHNQIPKLQEHEIVVGLARLVSSFKYGHTVLGFRYQHVRITSPGSLEFPNSRLPGHRYSLGSRNGSPAS